MRAVLQVELMRKIEKFRYKVKEKILWRIRSGRVILTNCGWNNGVAFTLGGEGVKV